MFLFGRKSHDIVQINARLIAILLALAFATQMLCSCDTKPHFETDKLHVICTVYPVYSLAKRIAGDSAEVLLLMTPGTDAHGYEPSSADIRLVEEADVIVSNGAGLETWLSDVMDAIENDDLLHIDSSSDVDLLCMEAGHNHSHNHSHGGEHDAHDEDRSGHEDEHDEGHEEDHDEGHEEEFVDPHTWLSFENLIVMTSAIAEGLSMVDPDNSDIYRVNASSLMEKLEGLSSEYEQLFERVEGQTLVVSHEAFGYICDDYGLRQLAVDGLSSEAEPDARSMVRIVDEVRQLGCDVIFYDQLINPAAARVIADETGLELMAIEAMPASYEVEIEDMLENNLVRILEGLV